VRRASRRVIDSASRRRAARWAGAAFVVLSGTATGCAGAQATSSGGRAAAAVAVPVATRTRADTAALRRTLDSLAAAHHGVVGYAVRNLDTGERLSRLGDDPFPTASLIKVPVLVALYDRVAKGELALETPIRIAKVDKVPGSGQLRFFHDDHEVTVGDAARLMITISDNTATNVLLDKVPMRKVWDKMEALGLARTKVHSKTFQRFTSIAVDSSAKYGLGVTTPNEMATLFALLAAGKAVSPSADSAMLDILAHNEDETKLQRFVSGVRSPHKTGDVDQSRTECALFELQSRVVACVLTKENTDTRYGIENEAHLTMARIGEAIVNAWPKKTPSTN
jgi:beta-lactamase class A